MGKRETVKDRYDRTRLEAALKDKDRQLQEMEDRLEATFDEARAAKKALEDGEEKWKTERYDFKAKIQKLEEEVKHERRRATQALDVAESTSDAAGGIGRLLRTIVDDNVLEQLRLANHEREQARKAGRARG